MAGDAGFSSFLAFFGGLGLATGSSSSDDSSTTRFFGVAGFFFSASDFGGRPRFLGSLGAMLREMVLEREGLHEGELLLLFQEVDGGKRGEK